MFTEFSNVLHTTGKLQVTQRKKMSFSDSRNGMLLSEVCRASRARPILPAQRYREANERYRGYQ